MKKLILLPALLLLLASCTHWKDENWIKYSDYMNCENNFVHTDALIKTGWTLIYQSNNIESNRKLWLWWFQERVETVNISKWKFGDKVYDCIEDDCQWYTLVGDELRFIDVRKNLQCKYYRIRHRSVYEQLFTDVKYYPIEISKEESKYK